MVTDSPIKKISKQYEASSSKDGKCDLEETKLLFKKHKPDYLCR